jgi:putative IMPACT (imprinted ancient) family translation regulator
MNASIRTAGAIAEDALDSLRGARETLQQMGALFNSLKKGAQAYSDTASLAALGAFVAMDQANSVDGLIEDWQRELLDIEAAAQNTNTEIVSRTPAEVQP